MVALGVDLGNLAQAYNALYRVGVRGEHILNAKNPYISMLTPEQVGLAYTYGQMDGLLERGRNKNSSEVLQNNAGSGTIEITKSRRENSNGKQNKSGLLSRDPVSDREGYSEISSESKRTSGDIDSSRIHRESGKIRVLSKDSEGRSIKPDTLSKISQTAVADVERNGIPFDYIEYLSLRGDNRELDIIKENPESEAANRQTEATAPKKEFSNNSIPQKTDLSTRNSKKSSEKSSEVVLFSDRDYDAPTNREILANLLETEDMSPSEKGFLTKYKETKPHGSKTSKGEMIVPVWIDQEGMLIVSF